MQRIGRILDALMGDMLFALLLFVIPLCLVGYVADIDWMIGVAGLALFMEVVLSVLIWTGVVSVAFLVWARGKYRNWKVR
jgi:hypothetical protein